MTAAALLARIDALHKEAAQMERPFAALVARDLAADGALRALRVAVEALWQAGETHFSASRPPAPLSLKHAPDCPGCRIETALAEIARLMEVAP